MRLIPLVLMLPALARQGEKVAFKFQPKQGDVITSSYRLSSDFQMEMEFENVKIIQHITQNTRANVVTEFAGVSGGRLTRKVMDFREMVQEEKISGFDESDGTKLPL